MVLDQKFSLLKMIEKEEFERKQEKNAASWHKMLMRTFSEKLKSKILDTRFLALKQKFRITKS